MSKPLHLPDLTIRGFRGIDQLSIPRLGRVTLLAGKNGVGKTTVLEAVRVYAARGRFSVLSDLLRNREEVYVGSDDNGDGTSELNAASLFSRRVSEDTKILIGPESTSEQLRIEMTSLAKIRSTLLNLADPVLGLAVSFRGKRQVHWLIPSGGLSEFSRSYRIPEDDEPEPRLACECLGPDILREIDVARFWDNVALTDDEHRAVSALELIVGNRVTGVSVDRRCQLERESTKDSCPADGTRSAGAVEKPWRRCGTTVRYSSGTCQQPRRITTDRRS